jgi:hypothetical protein
MQQKSPIWLGLLYSAVIVFFSIALVVLISSLLLPSISDVSWQQEVEGMQQNLREWLGR